VSVPPSRLVVRSLKIVVFLVLVTSLIVIAQPSFVFAVLERLFPRILWRVQTSQPLVALTFDDGPHPVYTPQVLDLLARHRAHATFFLIGGRAAERPELVSRIRAEGHEIGNHWWYDVSTRRASLPEYLDWLGRTEAVLGIETASPKLFRPPGGRISSAQLTATLERGYVCVLGSAYPYDPKHPPAAYIRWLVSKNLAPGAIVILHDGIRDPSRTLEALPGILEAGEAKGLRFASVGELRRSRTSIDRSAH
jgi:peptidoglycan/xylan/chitin deacetylase (PgdA/CDA1 family)